MAPASTPGARATGVCPLPDFPLILVVEDEPIQALYLEDLLAGEGYRVALAATAAEVGEVLLRERPAAALVDMRLRDGLTGPEIARRLSELGVRVVVHSGERSPLEGVPADAWLPKPAARAAILAAIREVLRKPG